MPAPHQTVLLKIEQRNGDAPAIRCEIWQGPAIIEIHRANNLFRLLQAVGERPLDPASQLTLEEAAELVKDRPGRSSGPRRFTPGK